VYVEVPVFPLLQSVAEAVAEVDEVVVVLVVVVVVVLEESLAPMTAALLDAELIEFFI